MTWVVIPFRFPSQKVSPKCQSLLLCPVAGPSYIAFLKRLMFTQCVFSLSLTQRICSGPQTNWRSPDNVNGSEFVETPPVPQAKPSERATPKPASKMNGLREEHTHRGNGYISITGK